MLMDKCRLSIIIPVYNVEEYLDRCLGSILDQDFTSYEVILVDDGSTDSSPLICDRYSATDSRFRTLHKPNGGVSSARNAGLELAKGLTSGIVSIKSKDAAWGELFMSSMFLGMISAFVGTLFADVRAGLPGYIPIAVALVSAVLMAVCGILIKKCKMAWLEQYALPISMLGAMAASIPITALMG